MSKIIYLQDFHLSGKNSCNRIDNYYQSLLLKLDEVLLIAKKEKVKYIIDGGDFFDSSLVSNTIVDAVLDRIEKAKIKWIMLFGNHCQIGHNIENSKSTSLQHMFNRSKYVEHLTTLKIGNCIIQGFEYEHDIEQKIKEKGIMCNEKIKGLKMAVVHALITETPLMPQILHIPIENIKTNFNIVFVAHNHREWGIKEFNGVKYINIGCLGRRSVEEAKITPTVACIDTEIQQIELIPLKTAKKGMEVFDLKKVEENKAIEQNINNFIKSLQNTKIQGLNLRGLVELLVKENNIEKEIKDEVINRIGKFEDKKGK